MKISFPQIINVSDKIMVFGIYATAFFLPVASAFVESFFGLILFGYLIKGTTTFFFSLKAERCKLSFRPRVGIFLKAYRIPSTVLNLPIAMFLLIGFLTIFISHYHYLSLKGFFFKLLQGAFLTFFLIMVINSPRRLKIFLTLFLLSLTLIVIDGLSQYFTKVEFIRHHPITDGRVTASFRHANDLGAYLVTVLPIVVMTFLVPGKQFPLMRKLRYFLGLLFIMTLMCLGFSFSRGAWLSAVLSFFILFLRNPKFLAVSFLAAILFGSVFVPKMLHERSSNMGTPLGALNTSNRITFWKGALTIIKDHPILGTGLNTYSAVGKDYKIEWPGYPHNCFLQLTAEMGLVGLMAFLWMLFRLFFNAFKNFKNMTNAFWQNILAGALAGFFALLVHSFGDTDFYSVQLDNLMWMMVGLIVAIQHIGKEEGKILQPSIGFN